MCLHRLDAVVVEGFYIWDVIVVEGIIVMKKCFCLILLILVSFASVGCEDQPELMPPGLGRGMVNTPQERDVRVATIGNIQTRMILDDWDEIWFYDTNLKLTQWAVSVGD
jgi:hypothetical protein